MPKTDDRLKDKFQLYQDRVVVPDDLRERLIQAAERSVAWNERVPKTVTSRLQMIQAQKTM
jgi:hypothetical protein